MTVESGSPTAPAISGGGGGGSRGKAAPRMGLRREVSILLPVSLFLLAGLALFTLFALRSATQLLLEERRDEAARLAREIAAVAGAGPAYPALSPAALRRMAPVARGVAVLDAGGEARLEIGSFPPSPRLAPLAGLAGGGATATRAPIGLGPGDTLPDVVAGFAPISAGAAGTSGGNGASGRGGWVRVDLPARGLAQQLRGQRVLTPVVVAASGAVLLLVIVFLRHLLRPYEQLLARAREIDVDGGSGGDEVTFLLDTFDRAMAALADAPRQPGPPGQPRPPRPPVDDEIAALGRTLSPSLESGLLLLDRDARLLASNPAAAELLGLAAPTPLAALDEVLAPHPELASELARALAEGRSVQRLEARLAVGGEPRTIGLTVHPLRGSDRGEGGEGVRGYLVLFADLTEHQRAAEEGRLAESLAQLGELAAGVAHELRNSLATLRGYLSLLERGGGDAVETRGEYLEEMRREADHLQRVVGDFLTFARPGTARPETVDLAALVRRAAADPALAAAPVALALQADAGDGEGGRPLFVNGDPQLLERAFRNLLHNAFEASRAAAAGVERSERAPLEAVAPLAPTPPPSPIEVTLHRVPEGAEVVVADRGPGLPAAIRERLFHPFATGRPGGVGLGLALTHRIVVLHGGRIRLEDRPGGGTRAVVTLPTVTSVTIGNVAETTDDAANEGIKC